MATAAEAHSAISAAFETYIGELAIAASAWDLKPAAAAEGEDAWSARQVAEHIAGSGPFFGAGIAQAVGVDGPVPARVEFPDHSIAVEETRRTHGLLMDVIAQLNDAHLAIEVDHPRLGKHTVGGILDIVSGHIADHANQLKTLRS